MTHVQVLNYVSYFVLACSVLSSVLPPFEVFNFAPRFQAVYRIIGIFIGTIGAVNFRGLTMKLYSSYQQQGGQNGGSTNVSQKTRSNPS